jgi:TonB family protein
MAMPLRNNELGQPKSMQFAHFGVLDAGNQNKPSVLVSLFLNAAFLLVAIVISAAAKKSLDTRVLLSSVTFKPLPAKVEPIKPKIVPPKPPPPVLPDVPKIEVHLPKIVVVKMPDMPKPPEVKMDAPKPIIAPPAPAKVVAMAAPMAVNLAHPQAASVVNNDQHASAVRLGSANAPVLNGPAISSVNLGRGLYASTGTGSGPASTKVNLGSGSPGGSIRGNGVVAVAGIPHGVPGGTGTGTGQAAAQVNLGQATPPPAPKPVPVASLVQPKPAKVTSKPKPEYTAEARQLHIEGVVVLRIRVSPTGSVEVLGVVSGLGHGLDESAKRAILATQFDPATDGLGHAVVWDGIVNVTFQLAG